MFFRFISRSVAEIKDVLSSMEWNISLFPHIDSADNNAGHMTINSRLRKNNRLLTTREGGTDQKKIIKNTIPIRNAHDSVPLARCT